jgi:hypothetical protein
MLPTASRAPPTTPPRLRCREPTRHTALVELEERREGAFGRAAGTVLVAEGVLVLIHRFLLDVYFLAQEANHGEETHAPLPSFLPWLLATVAAATVVIWAGLQLRTTPPSAWPVARSFARADLVAAGLANAALVVAGIAGLLRGPSEAWGYAGWGSLVLGGGVAVAGLLMDALHTRSTIT